MLRRMFQKKTQPRALWTTEQEFDEEWKERIKLMAAHISNPGVVADFGCGMMWLEKFLPEGCSYLPIDFVRRDSRTIVMDLNKDSWPNLPADTAFLSGVLEYVENIPGFVESLAGTPVRQVILSYCTRDKFTDLKVRKGLNWASHLSLEELLGAFLRYYDLTALNCRKGNSILVFSTKNRVPSGKPS